MTRLYGIKLSRRMVWYLMLMMAMAAFWFVEVLNVMRIAECVVTEIADARRNGEAVPESAGFWCR